jgi:hypothetical protein
MWSLSLRITLILALIILSAPLAAEGQQAEKVYRIAAVFPALQTVAEVSEYPVYKLLLSELRHLGYVESRNLLVE